MQGLGVRMTVVSIIQHSIIMWLITLRIHQAQQLLPKLTNYFLGGQGTLILFLTAYLTE